MNSIVLAVVLCTLVGVAGAVILVMAAKFMAVEEDPRIEQVSACLAGANCGGCGYAGCSDYAKAVVVDGVACDKCAPGGPAAAAAIAKIMGGEASAVVKKAVVQCQGNTEHCQPRFDYKGIQSCAAASKLYGGQKSCSFACIGLGDCVKVCKFGAIQVVDGVAHVDASKCTGCGACANICPKQVIMIDTAGPDKPVVVCSNGDKGAVANKLCTTACIACGMCQRNCPSDAIHVENNVARIDYSKCTGCGTCVAKCPKKIITYPLKDAE
jgi:Na+-translocating ferredoxin:NAD+ oxidoreductase RNF subunit RnfB